MALKNFLAASSKRNMVNFGMFPVTRDLSWIADSTVSTTPLVVAYSATPTFDIANGTFQRITLTANVTSSSFKYNASFTVPEGTQFYLQIIEDATGNWTFALPTAVRNPSGLALTAGPDTLTTLMFQYRAGGWDFIAAPVEGPVS